MHDDDIPGIIMCPDCDTRMRQRHPSPYEPEPNHTIHHCRECNIEIPETDVDRSQHTVGPNGEAIVYLNTTTGTYHRREGCYGSTGKLPVCVGECLFDADCTPCSSCIGSTTFTPNGVTA